MQVRCSKHVNDVPLNVTVNTCEFVARKCEPEAIVLNQRGAESRSN